MYIMTSRAKVFHGTASKTSGGLTRDDLVMTKNGIRSRKKRALGKKNSWAKSIKAARKKYKVKGFIPIQKPPAKKSFKQMTIGEKLYAYAKKEQM